MFYIHTFEMARNLSYEEDNELKRRLCQIKHMKRSKEKYSFFKYVGLCDKGVTIFIFNYKFSSGKVILKINPQTVLREDENTTLFKLDNEQLICCMEGVKKTLEEYGILLSSFKISRIDFTRDIQFEQNEIVDIIIKLLRKTGVPPRYQNTKYGEVEYGNCYDITNSVNSVTVYNKERQLIKRRKIICAELMKGVMRIEVRVGIEDNTLIYEGGKLYFDNVILMEELAEIIIKNVFKDGFYLKLEKTKDILRREYQRKGRREKDKIDKMIQFAEKVALHRNFYECIRGRNAFYEYSTMQNILNAFTDKQINVVSISARENFAVIPDIKYLLGLKRADEMQRDFEFLIRNNLDGKLPNYVLR